MRLTESITNYTSDRVFTGVRTLTEEQTLRHKKRLERALERRKTMANQIRGPHEGIGG